MKATLKKTTMKELGTRLPIGFQEGGKLNKGLSLVPYKVPQERELAKLRSQNVSVKDYVATAIGLLVDQLGPHKLSTLGMSERKLIVGQTYLADVLYSYLCIRREALGSGLSISMECPRCKTKDDEPIKTKQTADLDTLDVRVIERVEDLSWWINLRDGIKVLGKDSKILQLGPAIWNNIDPNLGQMEEYLQIINVFRASLLQAEGVEGVPVIHDPDMDDMSRYDLAVIEKSLLEDMPGPELVYVGKCSECKRTLTTAINWLSPDFFTLASLLEPKTS